MTAPTPSKRLDHLDAVRAFALLLGIVFHAAMSFVPVFIGWAVMDVSTSQIVAVFALVSHSFRLELFFLIAGFFSRQTLHRNGTRDFVRSRLARIAVPFVAGWFLLRPLIASGWIMGSESLRGEVHVLNGLKAGFLSLAQSPGELFTHTHLWFLYYLILITAITLTVRQVARLARLRPDSAARFDRAVAWIVDSRLCLPLLSAPVAACLWRMEFWGMDTPDKSLVPRLPVLFVYGGFFAFGWLLHRQDGLMDRFARLTVVRGSLCVVSVGAMVALFGFQSQQGHPHMTAIRAGFNFSCALTMWSLVALSIGLFRRWFDRPSRIVRYLADSSYWLYIIHLPLVLWLQIAFAELPLHWSVKLPAISLLTVGASLALYDLLVRSTWIGGILNGRKKERALFRWEAKRRKR